MNRRSLRVWTGALVLGGCLSSVVASAQINPESGDVWVPPADDRGQQQQPWYQGGATGQSGNGGGSSGGGSGGAPSDGRSDHQHAVGRVAAGFLGLTNVPIGSVDGGGLAIDTIAAPTVGVRYWFSALAGIDLGLGLGYQGGNVQSGSESIPVDNAFGMAIHAGVPIAVFHERHYTFLVIPEANLAFGTGTAYGAVPDQDRSRDGFLFQLGGRVGTEIHFGFMDIPQLSLQASVGVYFNYTSASVGSNRLGTAPGVGVSLYELGTTVLGEPWDIFLGSLTALYYF
jgi:hypothetical protein